MTLDELEKMEPRAVDALVAERVMGYRIDVESTRKKSMVAPDGSLVGEFRKGEWCWFGYPEGSDLPSFSTDPAADYAVLVEVREKWDGVRIDKLRWHLDAIWAARKDSEIGDCCWYEPGDYSKAALLALDDTEANHQ